MAFSRASNKLERVAGGLHQLFIYITTDAIATVIASGYFNSMYEELNQYDVILVISETGGTPKIDTIFVTSASRAATVTTSATEGSTAT